MLTVVLHASLDGKHKVVTSALNHYSLSRFMSQVSSSMGLRNAATAPDMGTAFGVIPGSAQVVTPTPSPTALSVSPTPSPTASTTRTVTLPPTADTLVQQASSTSNFGSSIALKADKEYISGTSSAINSYLQFAIPALTSGETITGARLSLNVTNATNDGPAIYRTTTGWSESSMTWASGRPGRTSSTAVGNFSSAALARVSTSVSGITGAGDVSFELAPDSTDGMDFSSLETTSQPQLVLTVSS